MVYPCYRCAPIEVLNDGVRRAPSVFNDSSISPEMKCFEKSTNSHDLLPCTRWVYDKSVFDSTVMEEVSTIKIRHSIWINSVPSSLQFDLTCGRESWLYFSQSAFMIGMLLGSIGGGAFADYFGRRMTALVTLVLLSTAGVISATSFNFPMFLAMQLFFGIGSITAFANMFILCKYSLN